MIVSGLRTVRIVYGVASGRDGGGRTTWAASQAGAQAKPRGVSKPLSPSQPLNTISIIATTHSGDMFD